MNKRYRDILDSAASPHIPDNLNLFPRVAARLNPRKTFMQTLRTRPALAILLAFLAMLLLTGVAYAVGRLTGYIPGVGFVQKDSLRVLAEPVSQIRDGITVSIEQVFVDPERTIIIYKTEGLTIVAANSNGEDGGPFGSAHLLRLPDGNKLEESTEYSGTPEPLLNNIHTEGGWPNYVQRLVYQSVPSKVNELTLVIPVLQNMPIGVAPENWEITFHLKPAPVDMDYAPVIEFTPASEDVTSDTPVAGETGVPAPSNTATRNGFTLQLDNVIELEDGFVFTGNLSWDDSVFPSDKGRISDVVIPVLTDASGQEIPVEQVPLDWSNQEHKALWSLRTNRKAFTGPLMLSVESIGTMTDSPETSFELDLGSNPQVGQTWEFNHDFVFEGHSIRLLSVQLIDDPSGTCWKYDLTFNFASDLAGVHASVNDVIPQLPMENCSGGGGGGGPVDPKIFSTGIPYSDVPNGLHHFVISASIPNVISGPWQVTWNPPLVEAVAASTSEPGTCLTLDKWNQLSTGNDPLPSGLEGKILTTVNEGGLWPGIYVSNLDGANPRKIDAGTWPSLSTDGTRLAYSIGDGIHVFNLSTGENPAIGTDGYRIIWSPDNTRMMYTTTFTLNVVNTDGSGLQIIDTGSAQVISPVGWLPDNQTIIYAVMGGEGFTYKSHNLQSGETKNLFTFQNKAGYGAISPDGQWIVFADRIFGANNWGIFISRLDGSERRLVVEPEVSTAFASVWGPDGQWLAINTTNRDGLQIPVLVNPFTCQSAGLRNVNGFIEDWSP